MRTARLGNILCVEFDYSLLGVHVYCYGYNSVYFWPFENSDVHLNMILSINSSYFHYLNGLT